MKRILKTGFRFQVPGFRFQVSEGGIANAA